MEPQSIFDIAISVIGALGGWILKTIWDAIKELQKDDKELSEKLSHVEVLVAGGYVKVDKFDMVVNKIFDKLDKIDSKLDGKADK